VEIPKIMKPGPPSPTAPDSLEGRCLNLLRAPAGVRFPHVGRGFDGGNELEGDISHTDQANDGAGNNSQDAVVEEDAANEDIDWEAIGLV